VCTISVAGSSSKQNGDTYRAATVEFNPVRAKSPYSVLTKKEAQGIMMTNLASYEAFMSNASNSGVQIIVFPEYGLYSPLLVSRKTAFPYMEIIPDPSVMPVNPCIDWQGDFEQQYAAKVTYTASCLAIKYNMVLVINMGDLVPCNSTLEPNCPSDGHWMYNTQVAFDENGQILAKYHKTHLYYEVEFNSPEVPDAMYFDASFGVRFGMMICFDIMFETPTNKLLNMGIQNYVFSTWWVNLFGTSLLLTGTEMQNAWATTFGVNIIASGAGTGQFNSGSGIYSSNNILATFYNPVQFSPQNKMLIADVPKALAMSPRKSLVEASSKSTYKQVPSEGWATKANDVIIVPGETQQITINNNYVQCYFEYTTRASSGAPEKYSFVVADGNVSQWLFPVIGCGLVHTNPVLSSQLIFEKFRLVVQFTAAAPTFYGVFPGWLADQGQIFNADLTFEQNSTALEYTFTAQQFGRSLINVEIFGRY
jgi:predicted amidohydrolase